VGKVDYEFLAPEFFGTFYEAGESFGQTNSAGLRKGFYERL
jgi:hypothetical protein